GIEPGAQIAATGQPKGFRQQGNADELFYAWALDSVSLSGVVAGADSLDLPQASSPRGVHSRTPQTDEDQDGMDDDWELRYGLDPTDPSDADQDPDQDGYTNDIYANEDGEVLIVEPETSAGAPGGALTNLKEYIWGTDPTNPDTDGDGFTDGQDIAGLGQMQLALTVPPDAAINDAPVLRLTILGNGLEEFEPDAPLVKLDSSTTTLTVSDAERLDVRIETSNDNPTPGEQITLTAKLGSTDFQPGILTYTWFVNNVIQTEGSGESAFTFVYTVPETAVPGDVLLMGVSAANLETRQLAEAELEIRVGELMQLDYDPAKVEAGEELTVTATMVNDSDPTDLIFHWSLDGTELVDQSGQGKTSVTLSVPPGSGEQHSVGVDVTTPADSKPFAASQTQLIENQAAVSLVVSPESVSLGQVVTALAIPEHFAKDATLRFTWYVDDTLLEAQPTSEALEIAADEAGTHTVRVVVTSLGPGSETAEASAQFTVGDELQSSISAISERGETLASVRASIVGRPMTLGIFFGVFFAVLGIVSVLLIRRNALS
ncbi:MAG: hypothetical protein Q8P33_03055, partial [bacterium]|nr:hypothetical protein [bacterium]